MTAFIQIEEQLGADYKAGVVARTSRGLQGETLARLADANIDAGLGVVEGATPGQTAAAPTAAADVTGGHFLGVTMDPEFKNEIGAAAAYLAGDQISILEEGFIPVVVEEAVAYNDDVFVRHTANGGNTTLGAFRTDADSSNAVQVPNAKFKSATAGAGVALIRLK